MIGAIRKVFSSSYEAGAYVTSDGIHPKYLKLRFF